jgi:4'-phosphopantetheinyl transferase
MLPSVDEIHVYRLPLERTAPEVDRLRAVLDEEETARAERISMERFRRRYICARGLMRTVLGAALNEDPRELRFEFGEHGKPFLTRPRAALEFNLSHSGELSVLAVATARMIGVDLEQIRPGVDFEALARRHFRPEETDALATVDPNHRVEAFFRAWTGKEAYVKARGLRLPPLLPEVGVVIDPREAAAYTRLPEDGRAWSLETFVPADGYVAAVCVEGETASLRHLEGPPV